DQPGGKGFGLDPGVDLSRRIERRLGFAVLDDLDTAEKASAPDVADMRVLAEGRAQRCVKLGSLLEYAREQAAFLDLAEDGIGGGGGHGMTHVGMAVLEETRAGGDRVIDPAGAKHRANRLIARTEALGDGHYVGRDAILLAGEQIAGAPHATHHLVEDHQDAMAVADLSNALQVAWHGRNRPSGGADHRLGDEGHNVSGAKALDLILKLVRDSQTVSLGALTLGAAAILVAGADVRGLNQHWRELRPAPFIAAGSKRAQRVAVIALSARNHAVALRLADRSEERRVGKGG